jgi:hypothetical protein
MALIELYSIICVYGLGSSRAIIFGPELAMKGESLGHHAATQALVLSVAGVTAIVLIASSIFLILH